MSNLEKVFRTLVAANIILLCAFIYFDYDSMIVSSVDLTKVMAETTYYNYDPFEDLAGIRWIGMVLYAVVALLIYPALFFYVPSSRFFFTGVFILGYAPRLPIIMAGGFDIVSELEVFTFALGAAIDGAILILIYFTDLKERFDGTRQ